MPELPEVEVTRRNLARWLGRREVTRARVVDVRVLGGRLTAHAFERAVTGRTLSRVERRGKWLRLGGLELWAHLGMTGKWVLRRASDPQERFEKVRLDVAGPGARSVRYLDARVFGRVLAGGDAPKAWAALGPDPLVDGLSARSLGERLAGRRRSIKVALMDQSVVAGVGNIHATEALFRARVDPRRRTDTLTRAEIARVARGVLRSFDRAIADATKDLARGLDMSYVEEDESKNPFLVYGRAGTRCPRCKKATLAKIVQGGRSTVFCPSCQR